MKTNNSKGFTLLEAMIVVALLGILAAMAYPSFQNTIAGNRAKSALSTVDKALAYARSEAISRNRAVFVCPQTNPPTNNCGTSWSAGLQVVVDENYNNTPDPGDDFIQVYNLKQPVNITSSRNIEWFRWLPGGRRLDSNNGMANTTFSIIPSKDGNTMKNMEKDCKIATTGRVLCQ